MQVDGEMILAALVTGELRPFRVGAEAGVDEVVGQAARPLGDVGPGQSQVAEHETLGIRPGGSDRLVHFCHRKFH